MRLRTAQWWLEPVPRVYVVALFLAFCIASAWAAAQFQADNTSSVRSEQATQHSQLVSGCERSNVTRAGDNASHWADYGVDLFVSERFTKPTKTETAAQKLITRQFAGRLRLAVSSKAWTPLIDCARAVAESGAKYQSPQPVPFSVEQPPASAMSFRNAALLTPVGSESAPHGKP